MDKIKELVEILEGKKSYLVGVLMVGVGIFYQDKELVFAGLSVITLRAGIAKK